MTEFDKFNGKTIGRMFWHDGVMNFEFTDGSTGYLDVCIPLKKIGQDNATKILNDPNFYIWGTLNERKN